MGASPGIGSGQAYDAVAVIVEHPYVQVIRREFAARGVTLAPAEIAAIIRQLVESEAR